MSLLTFPKRKHLSPLLLQNCRQRCFGAEKQKRKEGASAARFPSPDHFEKAILSALVPKRVLLRWYNSHYSMNRLHHQCNLEPDRTSFFDSKRVYHCNRNLCHILPHKGQEESRQSHPLGDPVQIHNSQCYSRRTPRTSIREPIRNYLVGNRLVHPGIPS